MIFITFDPYNDYQFTYNYRSKDSYSNFLITETQETPESIETECFICMQEIINNKTIHLNKQLFYWKDCECDGDIHKECLDKWATLYNNCPICRINMIKNNKLIIKYINSNSYFITIYFFLKKNLLRIKISILIFFFLYNIFILIIFPIFF